MNHSPPGSSVPARILEWLVMPSSRESSWLRDRTRISRLLHRQVGSLPLAPPGKSLLAHWELTKHFPYMTERRFHFKFHNSGRELLYKEYRQASQESDRTEATAHKELQTFTALISMGTKLGSSDQFSRSVVSNSLQPHESQHAGPPCPSPTPGIYSNSHPSSWWCHPAISSSVVPFSSCPQSLPASGSFPS